MRALLAYNGYDSVSGETAFFDNMGKALEGKGFETLSVAIPQMPQYTLAGAADMYIRFPMLAETLMRLRKGPIHRGNAYKERYDIKRTVSSYISMYRELAE